MKAITIKQPWASLIVNGYKKYEFRTWNTKYRGVILIHAGKSIDKKAMRKFNHLNIDFPTGCIIGKCEIVDTIRVDDRFRELLKREKTIVYDNIIYDSSFYGYAFKLENVKKLFPISINGKLNLWNYDNINEKIGNI